MPSTFRLIKLLCQDMGLSWMLFRAKYALQQRSGWLRCRMPAYDWSARPLGTWLRNDVPKTSAEYKEWRHGNGGRFFFDSLPEIPAGAPWDSTLAVEAANAILAGQQRYFGYSTYAIGYPPNWYANPLTNQQIPHKSHWSQIDDFAYGDIKLVWEASRFGCVYTLARAYAASYDERYPSAFWELLEHWAAKNPPNVGPNWKCGQEAAIRVIAWCFGLYAFANAESTSPDRVAKLATMVAAHAERIERNIAYAQSQKNNHVISEAVGLWTVGLLFPEFKQSASWQKHGRRLIEFEVARQVYDDGSYVQHSTNYHRLMLHDLLWALRLGEVNNRPLSDLVYERFQRASIFLYQLLDCDSGRVPNCGANDGALILPIDTCDYSDYRPVLQASYYLLNRKRLFESGPWDEDLLWLFGVEALESERESPRPAQVSVSAVSGGYYTLRGTRSWAMVRCADYRDRPSQADQLHFDLWSRGINIACDAGTYLYNGKPPWNNGLSTTVVHNTVTVDNQDQMVRYGRFLWLKWARGLVLHQLRSKTGHIEYWEGQHDGYKRLKSPAIHRRAVIRLGSESWLVLDVLNSTGEHNYALHWLFPYFPYQWDEFSATLTLNTDRGPYRVFVSFDSPGSFHLRHGDATSVQGWRSFSYAHKEPAISLVVGLRSSKATIWTLFTPFQSSIAVSQNQIDIKCSDFEAQMILAECGSLVRSIGLRGALQDSLEI